MSDDLTPGELSRRVQDVLQQFESLVRKVEERYVQKESLNLIRESIQNLITGLQVADQGLDRSKVDKNDFDSLKETVNGKASSSELAALKADVDELKDNNKWLFRLVVGFIILAILGAVFTAGGGLGK